MRQGNRKPSDKQAQTPELEELMHRLDSASKRLNGAARRATRRIEAVEERLVRADPGIEVWGPTLLTEATTFQREGEETTQAAERVVTLGYAKVKKDRWGLAVREVVKAGAALLSDTTRLLHKAEREVRLLAVPQLTALTRQIVEALERQAAAIDDGGDEEGEDASEESATPDAAHAQN